MLAEAEGFPLHRHNVFFGGDSEAEFADLFARQRLPADPTVYVCAQDRGDDAAQAAGPERLLCLVNAPPLGDRRQPESTEIAACATRSFALLARCGLRLTTSPEAVVTTTPRDFDRQLSQLQEATPLAGLVLDLRGNPGGVLESAVSVADEFLESGVIVRAEGRTADSRFEMRATDGDLLRHAPLVVLVDRGSASGAEIVAGALRDHRRATLMGERTFGKGSVQTVMPLSNGQALKLTTSRYFTPSGASIHDRGIEPDVSLAAALRPSPAPRDAASDPAVQAALQYLRDRSLGTQVALVGNP
jgi:hypothetical protein